MPTNIVAYLGCICCATTNSQMAASDLPCAFHSKINFQTAAAKIPSVNLSKADRVTLPVNLQNGVWKDREALPLLSAAIHGWADG